MQVVWFVCRLKRELEKRGGGGAGSKKVKRRRQKENGETEEIEEEGEEGSEQSAEDKIKLEQARLEEDKKALQENHSMMAEVCASTSLFYLVVWVCFYCLVGSISVSGQLPTHPSLNPTLTLSCFQLTVVELGEGWVGGSPDTDIDPSCLPLSHIFDTLERL